jgi:integrase
MLTLFRRHKQDCGFRTRKRRNCHCPIHVEGTLRGIPIRKSLDLSSWDVAQSLIREWEAEGQPAFALTVSEACENYLLAEEARHLRPGTITKIRQLKKSLLGFCEKEGIRFLSQLGIEQVAKYRQEWPDAASTGNKRLERLKTFFSFCVENGWLKKNPAKGLKPAKERRVTVKFFSPDQMSKIMEAVENYPSKNSFGYDNRARVRAFVLLLRYSGLRIQDAATLEKNKVQDGNLQLYTQKSGVPVWLPLPPVALKAMEKIGNGEYFFWSGEGNRKSVTADWQRALRRVFKIAGINGNPHMFRHTFSVSLLEKGVPIEDVSILLGHSSLRITEKYYAHFSKARQERLGEFVKKIW